MKKNRREEIVEHNKGVIATYSREKLIEIANMVGAVIGGKRPESLTTDELKEFVLALSQGI